MRALVVDFREKLIMFKNVLFNSAFVSTEEKGIVVRVVFERLVDKGSPIEELPGRMVDLSAVAHAEKRVIGMVVGLDKRYGR